MAGTNDGAREDGEPRGARGDGEPREDGEARGGGRPRESTAQPARSARGMRRRARLALGQWYTPPEVADLALGLALPADARAGARVLDPACGDGVFLARAACAGVPADRLVGIDIDPAAVAAARAHVRDADIRVCDVFDLAPGFAPGLAPATAPGFDAVVGNPPYVRQERLPAATKRRIRDRLAADWPDVPGAAWDRALGRGDLAAAVILRALRLVRPGGRVAMVVSSALLDAGYADALWRIALTLARPLAVIDAPDERWFPDAAVNAVIAVLQRLLPHAGADRDARLQVARLSVPTARAAERAPSLATLHEVARVRAVDAARPARWAAAMRAPDAWFALAAHAGDALVPLGELARIRRGTTSGANDVFYLSRERAQRLALEPEVLIPLFRSPRLDATHRIDLDPADTGHVIAACPTDPDALAAFPAARRYLESCADAAERPSLRRRRPWWSVSVAPARLFLTKAYGRRFVQRLARAPLAADQRVYAVHPRPGVDVELLCASLNATFGALAIEALGRASMGEGALEWTVADAARLPVLDPRRLDAASAAEVRAALHALATRAIGDVEDERDRADRARLDRAVAAIAPGADALLPEIWAALIASVARRHARAVA